MEWDAEKRLNNQITTALQERVDDLKRELAKQELRVGGVRRRDQDEQILVMSLKFQRYSQTDLLF
jgi:hypothetical protein